MPSLEEKVSARKRCSDIGDEVECIYGVSKVGQRFALLVTKVVWYALRLIMDEEERNYGTNSLTATDHPSVLYKQYATKDKALQKAQSLKSDLEAGRFENIYRLVVTTKNTHINIINMPTDCATNPDKYLQPGDALRTYLTLGTHHDGIYIGNGRVAHISLFGEESSTSEVRKACIGLLSKHFVKSPDSTVQVMMYRIRCRTPQDIVRIAANYAEGNFRAGEYNLFTKNCQHFVTLCTINYETSDEGNKGIQAIAIAAAGFVAAAVLAPLYALQSQSENSEDGE